MGGILADHNVEGQVRLLVHCWEGSDWREFWEDLHLSFLTFAEVGLATDSTDREVWIFCQRQRLILITSNRNMDDPDSLEETIRNENTSESLPVFTLTDAESVMKIKVYREKIALKLLEKLSDVEKLLGTGRIFIS